MQWVKYLCVYVCIYFTGLLHSAVKFQGYTLMNYKLWGKKSGHGKENKAKEAEERFTLCEQARQLKADAEFQRKNQVGSWPQEKTVASTLPCRCTHPHAAADDTCSAWSSELRRLKGSCCASAAVKHFSALLHLHKTEGWM